MARSYHVDIARHATGADSKWVDNLLSHFQIPGVDGGRQGSPRRISEDGIVHIALIRELTGALGLPLSRAVPIAGRLLAAESETVVFGDCIAIAVERVEVRRRVGALIADAVESVVPVPRGRPSSSPKRP